MSTAAHRKYALSLLSCILVLSFSQSWAQHTNTNKAPVAGVLQPSDQPRPVFEGTALFDPYVGKKNCEEKLGKQIDVFNKGLERAGHKLRVKILNCEHKGRRWLSHGGASEVKISLGYIGRDCDELSDSKTEKLNFLYNRKDDLQWDRLIPMLHILGIESAGGQRTVSYEGKDFKSLDVRVPLCK